MESALKRRLVSTTFRPAASYLLDGSPTLPPGVDPAQIVEADVGRMLTHPDDTGVGCEIRATRTWEPGEGRFLRSTLRPGMNAIDVGANIGYFTLLMSRAVTDSGQVLAIEAEPQAFQMLRANLELNAVANVELLPVAAHRTPALIFIARNPDHQGGITAVLAGSPWQTTPVQAVRLDDVLDPDVPVAVVKIDVEGMDHAVVQGLSRTLQRWQPTVLVEFNPGWIDEWGEQPAEVLRSYRDLGYHLSLLGGDALRLHRLTGMPLDELLLDNLAITPRFESELIERARQVYFINLVLTPA